MVSETHKGVLAHAKECRTMRYHQKRHEQETITYITPPSPEYNLASLPAMHRSIYRVTSSLSQLKARIPFKP